jgi:large subunit ribosomal protein L15e
MLMKYLSNLWKRPREALGAVWKQRLTELRKAPTVVRLEGPTRPDRARSLGYKAKEGFAVVRVKVKKGKRKRPKPAGGRRPKRAGRFFTLGKSKQQVAEERASRKFPNMEVINSYYIAEDGEHKWFEVIMADRSHPAVLKDKDISWVASPKHKGRAFRGLTSAGKKGRGLRKKGKGAEKVR